MAIILITIAAISMVFQLVAITKDTREATQVINDYWAAQENDTSPVWAVVDHNTHAIDLGE